MNASIETIIPIIIVIVTLLSFLNKTKKDAETRDRSKKAREIRPADLPEKSRRQIYGPQPVRRARPLVAQPAPPVDYDGEGVNDEGAEFQPPRVPGGAPTTRYPQPSGAPSESDLRRYAEEARRVQEEQERRRVLAELERATAARKSQQERASRSHAPASAPQSPTRRPTMVQTPSPEMRRGPVAPIERALRERAPGPRKQTSGLLKGAGDLRRAIVLREILGPPKGLE